MSTDPALYMTFKLGDELFAIPVAQVREVLELTAITAVPGAPAHMRGLVNVRGKAIPVVDLRLRFGLPAGPETVNTRIVVMELELEGEVVVVGGLADSVQEVIEVEPAQIQPPPKIGMRWKSEFIRGISRRADDFLIILEIQALFVGNEIMLAGETVAAAE
jgi:purine-binding chemotaxis protein CheW